MDKILVSEEGYNQFFEKLESLKKSRENNAHDLSKSYNDYVGDGWHDNPMYEEAMRKSRMIDDDIQKMLNQQKNLEIIKDEYKEDLVNLNDIVMLEFLYPNNDKEVEMIKLTGKFIPNLDLDIQEITLNSPVGNAIYKKKVGKKYSCLINNQEIIIYIIKKIKENVSVKSFGDK